MITNYLHFDLGDSYYRDTKVIDLILEKCRSRFHWDSGQPCWFISSQFRWASKSRQRRTKLWHLDIGSHFIGYTIPSFFDFYSLSFCRRTLFWRLSFARDNFGQLVNLPWWEQALDYMVAWPYRSARWWFSGFAGLTMLTKNSFLDEIGKQYVLTAPQKAYRKNVFSTVIYLPQRHADCHCGLSSSFHAYLLHRIIADRSNLLAGWAGITGLRSSSIATIRWCCRNTVYLRPDRISHYLDPRHHLRHGRPRINFRGQPRCLIFPPSLAVAGRNFKANKRGYWSLWIFLILLVMALCANVIANSKPILVTYQGSIYTRFKIPYPKQLSAEILKRKPIPRPIRSGIDWKDGTIIWPQFAILTTPLIYNLPTRPSAPTWTIFRDRWPRPRCRSKSSLRLSYFGIIWLGFDNIFLVDRRQQAFQGFYGGKVDLIAQRVIEIWSSLPSLYILIIFSYVCPGFWTLLLILLLFSRTHLVDVVRAEFYAPVRWIMCAPHMLLVLEISPDAPPYPPQCRGGNFDHDMPFILTGSITALTSLDFFGSGLCLLALPLWVNYWHRGKTISKPHG